MLCICFQIKLHPHGSIIITVNQLFDVWLQENPSISIDYKSIAKRIVLFQVYSLCLQNWFLV